MAAGVAIPIAVRRLALNPARGQARDQA